MKFSARALEVSQGGRTVYVSSMTIGEADKLLPRRLEEDYDVITETNRAIDVRHVERIVSYIESRHGWYLSSITLSAPESALSYSDGEMRIEGDVSILDGQHRRLAIARRIHALSSGKKEEELAAFQGASLPFCLVVESDASGKRQIFADMAKAKSIDKLTQLEFDSTDPFNNVARVVTAESEMLGGRIHPVKGSSVRTADEWLLSKTDVKTAVTIVQLGLGRNANLSLRTHYRTEEREREMVRLSLSFFDDFLPESRDLFREIVDGGIERINLPLKRYDNWELEPLFINLFAGLFSQWVVSGGDVDFERLALYLRDMDMSRQNPRNLAPVLRPGINYDVPSKARPLPIRNQMWRKTADMICRTARGEATL